MKKNISAAQKRSISSQTRQAKRDLKKNGKKQDISVTTVNPAPVRRNRKMIGKALIALQQIHLSSPKAGDPLGEIPEGNLSVDQDGDLASDIPETVDPSAALLEHRADIARKIDEVYFNKLVEVPAPYNQRAFNLGCNQRRIRYFSHNLSGEF